MDNDELSESLDELENEGGEIALSYEWGTGASRHRNNAADVKERILADFRAMEAENARLRAALEQMEWIENDMGAYHCPWCYGDEPNHEAECPYKAVMRDEA